MYTVIWDEERMLEAPVADAAVEFLDDVVGQALEPIHEEAYRDGPAVLLSTDARHVYVVTGDGVLWVVEWPPGVVVVRFSPDGSYAAARLAVDEDDEDEHPAVELVAAPWAARFDADDRADLGFVPASDATRARWTAAMAAVERLAKAMSETLGDEDAVQDWQERAAESPWVRTIG